MSHSDTEQLAKVIERRHQCLQQLRDLGRRQAELAEQGDLSQLMKLLGVKNHLIGLLRTIDQELAPFRGQDPETRRWASPADRDVCRRQAQACEQLLAEVIEQERRSESTMTARRDEAANRLQGAHVAQQARRAYQVPTGPVTGRLDLSSGS